MSEMVPNESKKVVLNMTLQSKKKPSIPRSNVLSDSTPSTHKDAEKGKVQFISSLDKSMHANDTPKLVIPLTKNSWEKDDQISTNHAVAALLQEACDKQTDESSKNLQKIKPILQSSMIPGLVDIENEDEKFKHDVASRAENIDVHSECYSTVPIANFGEALLRGLGWDGSATADQVKREVRPQRLGLGARARPPSPVPHRKTKPGQVGDKKKNDDSWQREAERKLKEQTLSVGDIVWLRGSHFIKNNDVTRARVHRITGVAGLNQIEVLLEGSEGIPVSVTKTDAVLIDEIELKRKPFVDMEKKRPRSDETDEDVKRHKKKSWLLRHIKVRIVKDGKYHRMKGEVVKAEDGECTVQLEDGSYVSDLKETDVESVIPSVGEEVIVLRGDYRRMKGIIVEKFRDKEEVLLEVNSRKKYFSFDDVTAVASSS
jgi:hypothetical protein